MMRYCRGPNSNSAARRRASASTTAVSVGALGLGSKNSQKLARIFSTTRSTWGSMHSFGRPGAKCRQLRQQ